MKITNGHQHYWNAVQSKKNQAVAQGKVENEPAVTKQGQGSESVQVEISEEAKRLSETMNQAAPSERAAAIRQAIESGSYRVSPERIAESMINAMNSQKEVD